VIPKKLKIGATEWSVTRTNIALEDSSCGLCVKMEHRLEIDKDLIPAVAEETFLHEVLHACCDFAGIQHEEELTEEQFISRVSPILYTVLKENTLW